MTQQTTPTRYGIVNHPALTGLSPLEVKKQIRRWRYHRMYQRKRLGDSWQNAAAAIPKNDYVPRWS